MRPTRIAVLSLLTLLTIAPVAAAVRLTCTVDGQPLALAGVKGARATVSDGSTTREIPEPADAAWSLEFDPVADARLIHWSPEWLIKRDDGPDKSLRRATPYRARVVIGRWRFQDWNGTTRTGAFDKTWPSAEAEGGALVVAWLEDGRATHVQVLPVPHEDIQRFNIKADFLLSEQATRGRPVVLLWREGRFVEVTHPLQAMDGAEVYLALMRDDDAWLAQHVTDFGVKAAATGEMLFLAVQYGCTRSVALILERAPSCGMWQDSGNRSALHVAAEFGRTHLVDPLLEANASPRARTNHSAVTALHLAARGGFTAIVQRLIAAGADARITDHSHHSVLGWAIDHGYADIAEIAFHPDDRRILETDETEGVLINQANQGHSAMVAWLVGKRVRTRSERNGISAILAAAQHGDEAMLNAILQGGGSLTSTLGNGRTALMLAAAYGNLEYATALIQAGATVDAVDQSGRSALHFAAINDHADVVRLLLDQGASMDRRDQAGRSAMELATRACAARSAALLAARGSHFDLSGPDAVSVLETAIRLDLVDMVRTAVADGWSPNTELRPGWPALHLAAASNAHRCSQLLREAGATATAGISLSQARALDAPLATIRMGVATDPRDIDDRFPAARIVVDAIVDADGSPLAPIVRQCDTPELVPYALAAILETRFAPLTKGGKPAATTVRIPITFPSASARVAFPEETDELPRAIHQTTPQYPGRARDRGAQARVHLRFTVGIDGTVSDIEVTETTGREFSDAAIQAVKTWRFKPGMRDGKPVAVRLSQPMTFTLNP